MPRILVIGDIHGCPMALASVLGAAGVSASDTVVTLGDYVDRGPNSRGVLQALVELDDCCRLIPLLGNHELMMLSAREHADELPFWQECGGRETLASYGGSLDDVPQGHWDFLARCRRSHETAQFGFIHANYQADLPLDETPEELAYWTHLSTRRPQPHRSGKTIFVGHTPQPAGGLLDLGHVVCIDTFCCGNGFLTLIDAESREIWQADKRGQLRTAAAKTG